MSPSWRGNAIALANPSNMANFWREYPHKIIQSYDQERSAFSAISDSRYAHTEISAGRPILQDMEIINQAIKDNSFYRNRTLIDCFNYARDHNSNIHFIGLISDVGLCSHLDHLNALLEMASRQNFSRIYIDCIADGIDSEPREANKYIEKIQKKINELGIGKFSSISGRNWAMPDTFNLNKISSVWNMLFKTQLNRADSIEEAINQSYKKGLFDSDILPTLIHVQDHFVTIKDYDVVIFFNFRPKSIRWLVEVFNGANPNLINPAGVLTATFTGYSKKFNNPVIFPRSTISDVLPAVLAKHMKTNLRVTESVKKYHLTYFFDGLREEPLGGEQRIIIDTSKVHSYDQTPELSGRKITDEVVKAVKSNSNSNSYSYSYDFIVVNFPNADVMAHTNNINATQRAILAVDGYVKNIVDVNLSVGGATIITADHGNAEQISINRNRRIIKTIHTLNPVPFILISKDRKRNLIQGALSIPSSTLSKILTAKNTLADIAPTILELMGLPKPQLMTGHSLLKYLE